MLKILRREQFYVTDQEEVIKIQLSQGYFICGHDPLVHKSFCWQSSEPLNTFFLLRWMAEKASWVKTQAQTIQIKAVGDEATLAELERAFRYSKIDGFKKIAKNDVGEELYFYSKSGRLRVEKREKGTSSKEILESPQKIRVLLIDDSLTVHKLLKGLFKKSNEIEVVGSVFDPFKVEAALEKLRPDVLSVDIHMAGMNGVQLLKKILPRYRIPSLLVTSLGINDGPLVLEGLRAGAVDYLQKPKIDNMESFSESIVEKIKGVAQAKVDLPKDPPSQRKRVSVELDTQKIVALGASTGGTEALAQILYEWPSSSPPLLIVQHIPETFSKAFAMRLDQVSALKVLHAEDRMPVLPGHAYVAPGGKHMTLTRSKSAGLLLHISEGDPIHRHRPSVDVLFESLLDCVEGQRITAVLLTGMGSDGAKGLLKLKKAGAFTLAQDASSCVVYGMPKVALELGAVEKTHSLEEIPSEMFSHLRRKKDAA